MVPAAVLLALPAAGLVLLLATPAPTRTGSSTRPTSGWCSRRRSSTSCSASPPARRRAGGRTRGRCSSRSRSSPARGSSRCTRSPRRVQLVEGKNLGFVIATPVGLLLAAGFAAASAVDLSPARAAAVVAHERLLRGAVLAASSWAPSRSARISPLHRARPAQGTARSCSSSPRGDRALRVRDRPLRPPGAATRRPAPRPGRRVGAARRGVAGDRRLAQLAPLLVGGARA